LLGRFSTKAQIKNFIEIVSVEAELLHADRRTDGWMDKSEEANDNISQFCESL
jgi:hypothetical protein